MSITALLAGLLSGIIGAMGLGGGAVLIIYLSLFTETKQLTSQGINLLFFIPIGLLAVIVYSIKKQIKWKITFKIALWGLLGAGAGMLLTDFLGGKFTEKVFGVLLIVIGIYEILVKTTKKVEKKQNK